MIFALVGLGTRNARDMEHGAEGTCIYCGAPVKAINRANEEKSWKRGQRGVGWMHKNLEDWLNCPRRGRLISALAVEDQHATAQ